MNPLAAVSLISKALKAFKAGKQTVEEIVEDPDVKPEIEAVQQGYANELQFGDAYTKRARPTLIYLCALIIFNDFILRPYLNVWIDNDIPVLLTEDKFQLLIMLLTSLGLARSVLDKQGKWLEKLADRVFKQ